MATTTYGDISQRTAAWAAVEMLSHAEPIIVLNRFGQPKPLPRNKADNVKFRRPIPFASLHNSPLTEGVTPAAQQMRYEDVPAQIAQYGAPTEITDYVNDLSEDPVLRDASMLSGEQAAETIEMVTWGILKAGTSVFYTNGAARTDVNTAITIGDQRKVTRYIKGQRGKKLTQMIGGTPNWSMVPVDAAYISFAHTNMESDLRDMTGFNPSELYGQMKALPYECGKAEDVRYILSPLLEAFADAGSTAGGTFVSTSGTNCDVYPLVYVGKESYGLVPLKGKGAIKPMVINPDQPSKSDPLGQRGYVSWKCYFVAVRLNETWMSRVESAATIPT